MQVVAKAKQHPGLATALAITVVVVLGFGIFWFGPQKLFLNETAAETLPGEQGNGSPADVNTLSEGTFSGRTWRGPRSLRRRSGSAPRRILEASLNRGAAVRQPPCAQKFLSGNDEQCRASRSYGPRVATRVLDLGP